MSTGGDKSDHIRTLRFRFKPVLARLHVINLASGGKTYTQVADGRKVYVTDSAHCVPGHYPIQKSLNMDLRELGTLGFKTQSKPLTFSCSIQLSHQAANHVLPRHSYQMKMVGYQHLQLRQRDSIRVPLVLLVPIRARISAQMSFPAGQPILRLGNLLGQIQTNRWEFTRIC